MIMDRLYGGVCYAGIDTDPELKYPKGAGRVAFSNQQSYIAAISARFVQLQHNDIDKRVSGIPRAREYKSTSVERDDNISLWNIKRRIEQVSSIHNCKVNRTSFIIAT